MGVHQPRRDDATLGVDHLAGAVQVRPDFGNRAVSDAQIGVRDFAAGIVHRNNDAGVFDQDFGHIDRLSNECPVSIQPCTDGKRVRTCAASC